MEIKVGDCVCHRGFPDLTGKVISINPSYNTADIILHATSFRPAERWYVCLENWKKI